MALLTPTPSIKRVLRSVNLAAMILCIGVLFIMVNYISFRRYGRLDVTAVKINSLSDRTKQILRQLREPIQVTMFYIPQDPQETDPRANTLYPLVIDLLKEYEQVSDKVKVEQIDPDRDRARAEQVIKQFEITQRNVVIFSQGHRHKFLSTTDLGDFDTEEFMRPPKLEAFKGEEAFTAAILAVTQAESPPIWFTTGHGEKSLDAGSEGGLVNLAKVLQQQNVKTEAINLLEKSQIPTTVRLVVIAGPTRRFTEQELLILESYLDHGGHLWAMIDPQQNTGLDGLLLRWGVELGMDIVVDPARQLPFVSPGNLFVIQTYGQHPIVERMQTLMTLFPLVRSVHPVQPPPVGLTVTPLATSSEEGWGETHLSVSPFEFNKNQDIAGPVPIAVAVERAEAPETSNASTTPRPSPSTTRLVVIGDSDFVENSALDNVGNRDLASAVTSWLLGQEQLIGIGPKPLRPIELHLTTQQFTLLTWFTLAGLPLAFGVMGTMMWLVRRR